MRNYDFHELLSFDEFQKFTTKLISIKENVKLKCNALTNDGGVDFYDLEENIIGQVKNYQNNFFSLKSSLKAEINRVKTLKPKRYILVTATTCSKKNKEELVSMFSGYLKFEDIIDRLEINDLLEDPKYNHLEKECLKLLVPNSFVLTNFLKQIEYNKIYTKTEIELSKIKDDQKIFFLTEVFDKALDKLQKEKVIIISGEPGVGKSILGRMLSAYLINTNTNTEFISISTIEELYQIYNSEHSQIYFFDDFWGDIKFNFQINTNDQKKLIDFIEYINKSDNKYLILTTREYILKDGLTINNKVSSKYLPYKFELKMEDISTVSKFNILYNHLTKTNLSWEHTNIVLRFWQNIVNHKNYTPRLISTFLEKYDEYRELSDFAFFNKFEKYLEAPYDYWNEILTKQPYEVIILLIIMALRDEKYNINILNNKFNKLISEKKLKINQETPFQEYIKKMENTFAITNIYEDKLYIEFRNPSYRDFILNYLERNTGLYLSCIFDSALTLKEIINLWKIININFDLYKDLDEVKQLDMMITKRLLEEDIDNYYYNILELAESTSFEYETKTKKMIVSKIINLLEDTEDIIYEDYDNYNLIFLLLKILYNKFDFSEYIYELLLTITFDSTDFYTIEKLTVIKEIYPEIYNCFYNEHKKDIKDSIYNCIISDALYYKEEKDDFSIELLIYDDVTRLYRNLKLRIPKKLSEELEKIKEETVKLSEDKPKKDYKIPKYSKDTNTSKKQEDLTVIEDKIREITGTKTYISNVNKFLKELSVSNKVKNQILELEKNSNQYDIFNSLIYSKQTLTLLCQYLEDNELSENIIEDLNSFVNFMLEKDNLNIEDHLKICNISFLTLKNQKEIFTIEELKNIEGINLEEKQLKKLLASNFFIRKNRWYHLIHPVIQLFLPFLLIRDYKTNFNISFLIELTENYTGDWMEIDHYNYDDITTYKLIRELFPKQWNALEKEIYEDFLSRINSKDEITITKSILKQFSISLYLEGYEVSYIYRNILLQKMIQMDFNMEILDLFLSNQELEEFANEFNYNYKEIDINKCLNSKKFINFLIDTNIVENINILYKKLLVFLNKDQVLV